jgi:CheY-like chemotaxis protein/predicted transcriptional regulator
MIFSLFLKSSRDLSINLYIQNSDFWSILEFIGTDPSPIDTKMKKGIPSMANILNVLSDEKALDILRMIAISSCNSDRLISKTNLNLRQYYSRMTGLIKVGLVRKKEGKYFLTSFGKVFYNLQIKAENTLSNYWKLKAIDSFDNLSKEEYFRLIESMIDNYDIKELLTKEYSSSSDSIINGVSKQKIRLANYHQQQQAKPSSIKIMLVEDEEDTLITYKKFLLETATEEYSVDAFTDSYEALEHFINLNHSYYDLVISDIRMPGLNGLQLYQKLRTIDNSIKVVFVSALDSLQEMVSIFPNLDFNNIVRKPVTQEDFLDKVKRALAA